MSKRAVTAWGAMALLAVLAIIAVVYFRPGGPQADLRRVERQNVLLVTIDTLRADRVGAYGHAAARTPAFDAIAREGTAASALEVTFRRTSTSDAVPETTDAVRGCPVSAPSSPTTSPCRPARPSTSAPAGAPRPR